MHFFRRNNKAKDLEVLRKRQIEEFEKHNPSAQAVDQNRSAFDMYIKTKHYGRLVFRINLDPKFPESAPRIVVLSPVHHRWVDNNMNVVGHPKISKWSPHDNLGKLVQEVYAEFVRNPPTPKANAVNVPPPPGPYGRGPHPSSQQAYPAQRNGQPYPPQHNAHQHPNQRVSYPGHHQQRNQQRNQVAPPPFQDFGGDKEDPRHKNKRIQSIGHTPQPQIQDSFPVVDVLSVRDLEEIVPDEELVDDLMLQIPTSASMLAVRMDLYEDVQKRAQKISSKKEDVESQEAEVEQLRKELAELQEQCEDVQKKQSRISDRFSLKKLLGVLDEATENADRDAHALLKNFVQEEEMGLNVFTKKYVKGRSKYHKLSATKERLELTYGVQ